MRAASARATVERIERYLKRLAEGVETEAQFAAACERAWRYYHRLKKEDRELMLVLMVQLTLHRYYHAERRRRRRAAGR